MFTVADIMTPEPVTLQPGDDLVLAENIFHLGRLRHLPVVSEGRLVGLVTHRDFLRALARHGEQRGRTQVASEVMTRQLTTVRPETPLRKALSLMMRNKFGCLPVTDRAGNLVGILTETDATRFAARTIRDLDQIERQAMELMR
ncbi:MAG TPA: CBS domain-containing protein [Myxococcaceae bacterium]|nr:CBS domain-containing protein [Myxococcaceae bacterium]